MDANANKFCGVPRLDYEAARAHIQSGDILLCSGFSFFSKLIKRATHSRWSHVAFILRLEAIDRIMVLESVETIGVRTVPLSSYAYNYNGSGKSYGGQMLIARHRDFKAHNIPQLSKYAVDLLGYSYDVPEIIHIATRLCMSALGFTSRNSALRRNREFICSEYAYECYASVGVNIEYNPQGFITPTDFAHSPKVDAVAFIKRGK